MEDIKKNSVVPALKSGSGVGSGLEASGRNQYWFGKLVKKRREALKISQEKLGKMVGVSTTTIQNWEAGTWPNGKYIVTLGKVLKCSLDYLLTNKEPEPGPPGKEKQIDKPEPLYNKVESDMGMQVKMPDMAYGEASLKDKLIYSQEKIITHLEKENSGLKARLRAIEKDLPEKKVT